MIITCSHCNQSLDVSDDLQGQTVECPSCHGSITVLPPSQQASSPSTPPSSQNKSKRSSYIWGRAYIRFIWGVVAIITLAMIVYSCYRVWSFYRSCADKYQVVEMKKEKILSMHDRVIEDYVKTVGALMQKGEVPEKLMFGNQKIFEKRGEQKFPQANGFSIPQNLTSINLPLDEDASPDELASILEANVQTLHTSVEELKECYKQQLVGAMRRMLEKRRQATHKGAPSIPKIKVTGPSGDGEKRGIKVTKNQVKEIYLYQNPTEVNYLLKAVINEIAQLYNNNNDQNLKEEMNELLKWIYYIQKELFDKNEAKFFQAGKPGQSSDASDSQESSDPGPQASGSSTSKFSSTSDAVVVLLSRICSQIEETTKSWEIDNDIDEYSSQAEDFIVSLKNYQRFRKDAITQMVMHLLVSFLGYLFVCFVLLVIADFLRAFLDMVDTIVQGRTII